MTRPEAEATREAPGGDHELRAIVDRFRSGACSAEIALMELLAAAEDVDAVGAAASGTPALSQLLDANRAGCERICAMLRSGVDEGGAPASSVAAGVAFARRLFDWSVQQDEETSVALYSLGNPDILARATSEVIELLARWRVLSSATRALEIGCGIGRLLVPLAARVHRVVGIDVSPRMVEVARRRCGQAPGVTIVATSGHDLADFQRGGFELVLAVDSFPYVVQAGAELAATMFAEVARVLVPGGHFALLGYSYRGDDAADRGEVAALARAAGLEVLVLGERPFALWNALAFLLRRPEK